MMNLEEELEYNLWRRLELKKEIKKLETEIEDLCKENWEYNEQIQHMYSANKIVGRILDSFKLKNNQLTEENLALKFIEANNKELKDKYEAVLKENQKLKSSNIALIKYQDQNIDKVLLENHKHEETINTFHVKIRDLLKCDHCNESIGNKNNMKSHVLSERGIANFNCTFCSKEFGYSCCRTYNNYYQKRSVDEKRDCYFIEYHRTTE